jgi:hypothetical protein
MAGRLAPRPCFAFDANVATTFHDGETQPLREAGHPAESPKLTLPASPLYRFPQLPAGRMPAMSRILTIAKYLPAVLCGLLVVAWLVSLSANLKLGLPSIRATKAVEISLSIAPGKIDWVYSRWASAWGCVTSARGSIPLLAPMTFLLPIAVGCLTRFRFPLWSWFAFTALVAVELAYYLR